MPYGIKVPTVMYFSVILKYLCHKFKVTMMRKRSKNNIIFGILVGLFVLVFSGGFQYLFTHSYDMYYIHDGPTESLSLLVSKLHKNSTNAIQPINMFNHRYIFNPKERCKTNEVIRILFVITSTADRFQLRDAIRKTWGDENRFSDVTIRRFFLLARTARDSGLQTKIEREANINRDIIQGDFEESYNNLTTKTIMGLGWTFHNCKNASYYAFVDDDIYVSTRNVLRFVRNPKHYPNYLQNYAATSVNEMEFLYAGDLHNNALPIRCVISKSYVSLNEYPYSRWPPYIGGGFYTLSRKSLEMLYYGSLYTNYYRLEDTFLGMAAKKAELKMLHLSEVYMLSKPYSADAYQWVLAVHGFRDGEKLIQVWNEQRAAGNA